MDLIKNNFGNIDLVIVNFYPFENTLKNTSNHKKIIENITNKECNLFAFPFGSIDDFTQSNINEAKKIGFKYCLLNTHGTNIYDNYALKRIIMHQNKDLSSILG